MNKGEPDFWSLMERKQFDLVGYGDERVPYTMIAHEQGGTDLAVVLPGTQYSCDMPLLNFPIDMALEQGMDLLAVEYSDYYRQDGFLALSYEEQQRWISTATLTTCKAALAERAYQKVTLIGKSLGTSAMAELLVSRTFGDLPLRLVWLTPLLGNKRVYEQLLQLEHPSLIVMGNADHHYDADCWADLQNAPNCELLLIEDAHHGLGVAGDVLRSLDVFQQVMRAVYAFISS